MIHTLHLSLITQKGNHPVSTLDDTPHLRSHHRGIATWQCSYSPSQVGTMVRSAAHPAPPHVPAKLTAPTDSEVLLSLWGCGGALSTAASSPRTALPCSPSANSFNTNVVRSTPLLLYWGGGREEQTEESATRRKTTGLHVMEAKTGGNSPKEEWPTFGNVKFHEKTSSCWPRCVCRPHTKL